MPPRSWRPHARAFLIFCSLAIVFAWPLPLHLSTHLTAPVSGDAGVYVWNQWVFRHELVEHRSLPYFTGKIFSLAPRANLSLHNYTTFANLVALPLMGPLGVVTTFNVVYLLMIVLSAYAMFLLARYLTGSDAESILAGALFAWSPVLVTRGMGHYSLVAAAPLPIFVLLLLRAEHRWRVRDGVLLGFVMAWAATTDVYYAVFCVLIAVLAGGAHVVRVRRSQLPASPALTHTIEILIVALMGLVVALALGRGWRTTFLGSQISIRGLYTPMLMLTVLTIVRVGLWCRLSWPRIERERLWPVLRLGVVSAGVAAVVLSPVLYALGMRLADAEPLRWRPFWRSGPPGIDLAALLLPNPNHPLAPQGLRDWLTPRADLYLERVASIPFIAVAAVLLAWRSGWRPPRAWVVLTIVFGALACGPFFHVAGFNTYVPGPWALLRYVPVVGLARTPSRFSVVLMLGVAVLFALAMRHLTLRYAVPRRWILAAVGSLLLFELLPAPRPLHAATVPSIYKRIVEDPRDDIRVLELPFGIRDGTWAIGNFTARSQFYQTVHEKPIVGGYLSRVSRKRVKETRRHRVLDVLIRLSANPGLTVSSAERLTRGGRHFVRRANLGYVVIDRDRASDALVQFAKRAFGLELLERDGPFELYQPR
jgi:hypothetical protein